MKQEVDPMRDESTAARLRRGAIAVSLAVGGVLAGTAPADAAWTPARAVGLPGLEPHVAQQAPGGLRMVWSVEGRNFTAPLTADGRPGPSQMIGESTRGRTTLSTLVGDDGAMTVASQSLRNPALYGFSYDRLYVRRVEADGAIGAERSVDLALVLSSHSAPVGSLAPNGTATYISHGTEPRSSGMLYAVNVPRSGAPTAPLRVDAGSTALGTLDSQSGGNLTHGPDSAAWITWKSTASATQVRVRARRLGPNGVLGPILDLALEPRTSLVGDPLAVVTANGTVTVMWRRDGTLMLRRIVAGKLQSATSMPLARTARGPIATARSGDRVLVAWSEQGTVKRASVAANGTAGAAQVVATGVDDAAPSYLHTTGGALHLAWMRGSSLELARVADDGTLGATQSVTRSGAVSGTPLAVRPDGTLMVGSGDPLLGPTLTQLDVVRPVVEQLVVPPSTPAGAPIDVELRASDAGSGLRDVRLDLGDGTVTDQPRLRHAYDVAGTYTVRATVTDRAGNSLTASRTIVVEGLPAARPPLSAPPLDPPVLARMFTAPATLVDAPVSSVRALASASGQRVVVWSAGGAIRYARLGPDGTPIGAPATIAASGASVFDAAISPAGTATVAWADSAVVHTVRVRADGTLGAARALGAATAQMGFVRVSVGPGDSALIGWGATLLQGRAIRVAADGTPGPLLAPTGPGGGLPIFDVAMRPDGSGLLLMRDITQGSTGYGGIVVFGVDAQGRLGAETLIGTPDFPDAADLAVGPDGAVIAAWSNRGVLSARTILPNGALGTPLGLGATASPPRVAAGAAGEFSIASRDLAGVFVTRIAGSARETGYTQLAASGVPVTATSAGTTLAAAIVGGRPIVSRPTPISPLPTDPVTLAGTNVAATAIDAAAGPRGELVVAWIEPAGLKTAVVDFAPPSIDGVTIPPEVVAGNEATLSVAVGADATGPRASWSFGDGATAAGTLVRHRFMTTGVRRVSVTVRDGAGHSVTARRNVRVLATSGGA
jgi:PKD repeat protein